MDTVRWGILGAAKFALEHMGPAIHAARGADLVALATSDAAKADPFRAFRPGLRVHEGYDALLADPEVDAIYIPLPNHLHVEWALRAVAAGKHVLCEKPFALHSREFARLIDARDASGLVVAEAYMIPHHPQWQRVRHLLADGAIGPLVMADAAFSYDNSADAGNIRNRPGMGGGSIRDIGVYTMGCVRYATGREPLEVSAAFQWENGIDTFAQARAQFPGFGFQGYTSMRMFAWQHAVFHGENGLLRLTAPFNPQVYGEARIEIHQPGKGLRIERFPSARQYVLQVEAFGRSVREGTAYPVPLEFSRGTQEMIDAAFASAEIPPGAGL